MSKIEKTFFWLNTVILLLIIFVFIKLASSSPLAILSTTIGILFPLIIILVGVIFSIKFIKKKYFNKEQYSRLQILIGWTPIINLLIFMGIIGFVFIS